MIDSIAFHFRHDLENAALRSRALHKVAAQLTNLAVQFQTAVMKTISIDIYSMFENPLQTITIVLLSSIVTNIH